MSFTRTNSGLSNLAAFHGVEVILFTEGGSQSFSFDDVCAGRYSQAAIDIKFWSGILSKHGYDKTVQYRALGSKTSSKKICELVADGEVTNVLVARDSDLDDFIADKPQSPFILHTRGYSWENDVYEKDLVKSQVESLLLCAELEHRYHEMIDECFNAFTAKLKRIVKLELIFRVQGKKFITKHNGERFINSRTFPKLKTEQIRKALDEAKVDLQRPINLEGLDRDFCGITFCYGKLVEAMAISLICYIVSTLERRKSAQKESITMAMIERYRNSDTSSDPYYSALINELRAA